MSDLRLERLAHLLVQYSLEVKPGDWVGITGDVAVLPLLRALHRAILQAGGHPSIIMSDEAMEFTLLREGSDEQLTWADPMTARFIESVSGREQRSTQWADARLHFDAGPGVRSEADVAALIGFFRARRGAARGFRFRDPFDFASGAFGTSPQPDDQIIGLGDGATSSFRLRKAYGESGEAQLRFITRPVTGSIRIALDGVEQASGWAHVGLGEIAFDAAPGLGVLVTAGFLFDVPVRFAQDRLDIDRETFAAGLVPSVPLVEIRE